MGDVCEFFCCNKGQDNIKTGFLSNFFLLFFMNLSPGPPDLKGAPASNGFIKQETSAEALICWTGFMGIDLKHPKAES